MVAHASAKFPRIYVDVKCALAPTSSRHSAAVDSCSTRSLVCSSLVTSKGLSVLPYTDRIVAIDGEALAVSGSVTLSVSRLDDDCVSLPETEAEFLVVDYLAVVNSDLLVGLDVISCLGGVSLQYDDQDRRLTRVQFGSPAEVVSAVTDERRPQLSRHVTVTESGQEVWLRTDDGEAHFDPAQQCWVVAWKWKDGAPPAAPLGSGIGEYIGAEVWRRGRPLAEGRVAGAAQRGEAWRAWRSPAAARSLPGAQADDTGSALPGLS